jgi:putative ABC transport system permease protein
MIPVKYNLHSLIVRKVGTLMTIFGVALTVAVFVSVLAMVHGLENTFVDTGEPLNLILIRQGSQAETNSFFDREIKGIVDTLEGVTAVAGEIIVLINHPRLTGESANIMVRGISEESMELRPKIRLAEGRMFRTGLREVIVSRSISNRFRNAKLGDAIKIGRTNWSVVGILDASHTAYDSEIWGDYNEVSQEFERPIYSSLLVRCADESSMDSIRQRLAADRRIKLDIFRETEYFESQTSSAIPIKFLGYLIAVIMAIGSSFAVMNTMYAATAYRTREIATLRVLGFKRRNILLSFMTESLLLSIVGGALGCLLALPVNGISTGTANMASFAEVVFEFRITPLLILYGMVFATVMGTIGGILPARLAARIPIVHALRTEV